MAGRDNDQFRTLGDDEFQPPDPKKKPIPVRDDEYRSLRPEDLDMERVRKDMEKTPAVPVFKEPKSDRLPPTPPPKSPPAGKPKEQFTRVGELDTNIGRPLAPTPTPPAGRTPKGLVETSAPDSDEPSRGKQPTKRSSLATPSPGKHRVDESSVSQSVWRTGRGGVAPQSGDDLAALLLESEIITAEDWEEALDKVDNNLANVPAILKQLSQQKASWTDDFPEHFNSLTEYQVREIWAGRGLGLRSLGEFVILDVIGEGGMGKVYKARGLGQFNVPRVYAIKTIKADQDDNQTLRGTPSSSTVGRFRQEAQVLARLKHPNLPTIYASDMSQDGVPFIVMDFLKGPTLEEIAKEKYSNNETVDWKWATEIILTVADVLQHTHTHKDATGEPRPVIHRDIKPANIIMEDGKKPMLVDLGIAKFATSNKRPSANMSQTAAGGPLGTPAYMPFEQYADASNVTAASDIYSLAGTYYNLLTGELPFPADDASSLMYQVMVAERPKISTKRKDVPKELDDILAKAMAIKPEDRYQTAQEFIDVLKPFVSEPAGITRLQIFSLAAIVAALGITLWAVFNPNKDPDADFKRALAAAPEAVKKAISSDQQDAWTEVATQYGTLLKYPDKLEPNQLLSARLMLAAASLKTNDLAGAMTQIDSVETKVSDKNKPEELDIYFRTLFGVVGEEKIDEAQVALLVASDKVAKKAEDVRSHAAIQLRLANSSRDAKDLAKALDLYAELLQVNDGEIASKARRSAKAISDQMLASKDAKIAPEDRMSQYDRSSKLGLVDKNQPLPEVSLAVRNVYANVVTDKLYNGFKKAEVAKWLERALEHEPQNDENLKALAILRLRERRDEEANQLFNKMSDKFASYQIKADLGSLFLDESVERADSLVSEIIKSLEPLVAGDPRAKKPLAEARALKKRIDDEKLRNHPLTDAFKKAMALADPERPKAVEKWANEQVAAKNFDEVVNTYRSTALVKEEQRRPGLKNLLKPAAAAAMVELARRVSENDLDAAMKLASEAQTEDPTNLPAYELTREIYLKKGDLDSLRKATELWTPANAKCAPKINDRIRRDWARAYLEYGKALYDRASGNPGDLTRAVTQLTDACNLDKELAEAYYLRARASTQLIRPDSINRIERFAASLADYLRAEKIAGDAIGKTLSAELAQARENLLLSCLEANVYDERASSAFLSLSRSKAAWNTAGQRVLPRLYGLLEAKASKENRDLVGYKKLLSDLKDAEGVKGLPAYRKIIEIAETPTSGDIPSSSDIEAVLSELSGDQEKAVRRQLSFELAELGKRLTRKDPPESFSKKLEAFRLAMLVSKEDAASIKQEFIRSTARQMIQQAKTDSEKATGFMQSEPAESRRLADRSNAMYQKALEISPESSVEIRKGLADNHLSNAFTWAVAGKFEETLRESKRALELSNDLFDAHFYRADAQFKVTRMAIEALAGGDGRLSGDAKDLADAVRSLCRAFELNTKDIRPAKVLLQILSEPQGGKLRWQFLSEDDLKAFGMQAESDLTNCLKKLRAKEDVAADVKAAAATGLACLHLYCTPITEADKAVPEADRGPDKGQQKGFDAAADAVKFTNGRWFYPLFYLANYQQINKKYDDALESLDKAEKATNSFGYDKQAIQDLRKKVADSKTTGT